MTISCGYPQNEVLEAHAFAANLFDARIGSPAGMKTTNDSPSSE